MNLLKALTNTDLEDTIFFENTYAFTQDLFNSVQDSWQESEDALAVVRSPIDPGHLGHVKFHGVRWRACNDLGESIPVGTQVRVLGRRANILVVVPVEQELSTSQLDDSILNMAAVMS
ncbi:MAG: hypothetical protein F6K42_02540 [Leptolyngbya sp. SIO1D8]|nr:hypothetical protein [Leptolyngbya sp. SIO1D8]